MKIAYVLVAVAFSLMLAMSARMKLVRDPRAVEVIGGLVGVPLRLFPVLALLELAGAAGLLAGIAFEGLGVAAAAALIAYFIGAAASHVRVRDFRPEHVLPALVLLVAAVAALVLRLAA